MAETVLITGGNGYLGSCLVPHLLSLGYRVRVLSRFSHRNPSLMSCVSHEGFEAVRGDCRDHDTIRKNLDSVDVVIPLAAVVGAPACDTDPVAAKTTNSDAVFALLSDYRGRKKILLPNTNSGYGTTPADTSCNEDAPLRPISLYGRTKAEAEGFVLHSDGVSFRLATAFGPSPRMRLDLLVNDMTLRAVRDKSVVLYEGHFRRNFIHVYDIARLFAFGIQNYDKLKGKPWNAGLHYSLTKRELCDEIGKVVPDFRWFSAPTGTDPDKRDYSVSTARLEAAGFKCCVSLQRGIRELVQAYKMLPPREFCNA